MKLRAHISTVLLLLVSAAGPLWYSGVPKAERAPLVATPASLVPGHQRLYAPIKRTKWELERLNTMAWHERIGWKLNGRDREVAIRERYAWLAELYSEWNAVAAPGDTLPAFVGAEGHGATARHFCRTLTMKVWRPTNAVELLAMLEDSTSDTKDDIVMPQFGGHAKMTSTANISSRCVYLAGQSAPGDGLTMSGPDFANTTIIEIRDSMIVVRYVRLRSNSCATESECINDTQTSGGGGTALSVIQTVAVTGANRIIVDHVSLSNSNDDGIVFWAQPDTLAGTTDSITNTTVQRTLFGVMLNNRSTCGATGGRTSLDGGRWVVRSSWHHNLFYDCETRSPAGAGGDWRNSTTVGISIIANLVYEHGASHSRVAGKSLVNDYINNVYDVAGTCFVNTWVRYSNWAVDTASVHAAGNLYMRACAGTFTGDDMVRRDANPWTKLAAYHLRGSALTPASLWPVTITDSSLVRTNILVDVGANERVDCSGTWVAALDSMDTDWTSKANTQTAPSPTPVIPTFDGTLDAGTACTDTDSDGMPDAWENRFSNVSATVADAEDDTDADGWPALEEYLNQCTGSTSCSPDLFTDFSGVESGGGGPSPSYVSGRFVYDDTMTLILKVTAGGADTDSVVRPDTSRYRVTSGSPAYAVIPFVISTPAAGDRVYILSDDSIVGQDAEKLDSAGLFDSLTALGLCASRGLCIDSLRNRVIP